MTVDLSNLVGRLVWRKDGEAFSAPVSFGEYRVARVHGEWMWFFAFNPKSNEDRIDQGHGEKNTLPSVKIAANADHAARVLAALDADALREALTASKSFLDACNSAWAAVEPTHKVKAMLDEAESLQAILAKLGVTV